MKITIYELLELVKDEQAPKKIKYRNMVYHINYDEGDYESDIKLYGYSDYEEPYYLFREIDVFKCLNDEVEILDNLEEKKKIPEKLTIYDCIDAYSKFDINDNRKAINEIIDYLKSKGE